MLTLTFINILSVYLIQQGCMEQLIAIVLERLIVRMLQSLT